MDRLKFCKKGEQKEYLIRVEKASGLDSEELAREVGVVSRSYRDWKREKFNIPKKAAEIFIEKYGVVPPEKIFKMKARWLKARRVDWVRGGLNYYIKYGNPATIEGRKKGGSRTLQILRNRGVLPQIKPFWRPEVYSEQLAEFVGVMLGDGSLGPQQWSITLNSIKDKEYADFVRGMIRELFGFEPGFTKRKDSNALVITGSGHYSVDYFVHLGLKVGNKVNLQVDVPEWIKSDLKLCISCVRGLIDTDGGVFMHKYIVGGKEYYYRKISFSNRSVPLLLFVEDVLTRVGLTPKKRMESENKQVWLYNYHEVEEYLRCVGTHNPRLLNTFLGGVA